MADVDRKNSLIQTESEKLHHSEETVKFLNLMTFLSEVSVSGVKYVANQNAHTIRRLVWGTCVVFGICFATFQIWQQINYFLDLPVSVKIDMSNVEELPFPTVSVCSNNIMNKSSLLEIDPSGNLSWTFREAFPPAALDVQLDMARVEEIYQLWEGADWDYIYSTGKVNHNKLLLSCMFDAKPCDMGSVKQVAHSEGNCLAINNDGNMTTTKEGRLSGLQLVLVADTENYNMQLNPGRGFNVYIHHYSEVKSHQLTFADVNHHTQIILASEKTVQLSEPYGSCSDEEGYVHSKCAEKCFENFIVKKCNCGWPNFAKKNRTCSAKESSGCVVPGIAEYAAEGIEKQCRCKQQCTQQAYPYTTSSVQFSKFFIDWLQQKYKHSNMTAHFITQNLMMMDIYYDNLQHTNLIMQPAYSMLSLLCDIGGALGLILGSTILTLAEILDFCLVSGLASLADSNRNRIQHKPMPA